MKIGDLVELSAYGRKLKMLSVARGQLGIVMEMDFDRYIKKMCVTVMWPGNPGINSTFYMKELKQAKLKGE